MSHRKTDLGIPHPQKSAKVVLDGLAQLDPNNQSLYQCIYPGQAETVTKWFTFDNPNLTTPVGTLIWNDVVWSKFGIAPQTQGLILLGQPTIEVKEWQWIQYSLGGAQDRNGTGDGFSGAGGWISCDKAAVGTGAQNVDIAALLPRRISWRTRRIKFTVTSKWGPKDADMVNYTACCAGECRRIRSEFSVDEVSALFERCRRLDRNSILHTIVEDHFLQLLPDGLNAAQMGEFERARKYFDWDNAIIDPLPWWLMPDSANYYDAVRRALSALPFEEPFDQFIDPVMTAAMARVYLPIRQGFEQAAVDFFSGRSGDLQNLISAFVRERNDRFGKYESRIPTANELCRPGYPTYTRQDQADWQNPWEQPARKFEVLGVWSELLPIDGVHAEPFLSARTAVDESHSVRLDDGTAATGLPAP